MKRLALCVYEIMRGREIILATRWSDLVIHLDDLSLGLGLGLGSSEEKKQRA